jgi:subtilisin family serine protease
MRNPFLRLSMMAIALTMLSLGCSREPSTFTAPSTDGSTGLAPLVLAADRAEIVAGSYIVVFNSTVTDVDREINALSLQHGITAKYVYRHALRGFGAEMSAPVVEALRSDPRIDYIEQDQIAHAAGTQTNPPSWGLDRVDQRALPRDYAYNYNQTGTGVDAYILDTGIRFTHVDFGGRAITGVDEITPGGTAADGNGHGTHVAGTVGGTSYGIAKSVRLISVRVLDNNGSGTYTQVIAGVDWVTGHHTTTPAVANMSLTGGASSSLDTAVRNSIADGVVYSLAAGNNGANASNYSPARVTEAITVGATDSSDRWASFSNYGSVLDILAPGVSITSAWYTSDTASNTISGTSMAAPHVAGAAALYLEAYPTSTPAQVATGLTSIATSGVITGVPAGTVNLLLYTLISAGPPPDPPAAPVLLSPADGATGVSTSPTLSWNASVGASSYGVQVSTSPTFSPLVVDRTGITTTSTTVTGLAANTVYYWRANATNAGGTSAWSATWSFTTVAGTPPEAPTLVSPANGSSNVSRTPTLTWNASTGATSYRVQVSTRSDFATTVYDQSGITSTSVTLPQLGSRVRYYWHVNASNAYGTSPWSSTWNFRTRR